MLYSQLYRSILRACRDFSRHPHTTTCLAISLPLLISVPSAYGAIVSPQAEVNSSLNFVFDDVNDSVDMNTGAASLNTDVINDSHTTSEADEYIYLDTVNTSTLNKPPGQDTDTATEIETVLDSSTNISNTISSNPNSSHLNSSNVTNSNANSSSTHSYDEGLSDTDSTSQTTDTVNQKTNASVSNIKQKVDESNTLSSSFEEDSVQKSLARLSQFYQEQSNELRSRLETASESQNVTNTINASNAFNTTNVIDAQATAPIAATNIFNYQLDDTAAYRCEGVWVTPSDAGADADYRQAVQRAQREDGLSLANGLPLHAQADYGYYDNEDYVELAGNVKVMQDGKLITADQMALDLKSGISGAKGGVLLSDSGSVNTPETPKDLESLAVNKTDNLNNPGMIVVADELAYNSKNSQATAHDVAFASVQMQAHGYAKTLNKADDSHFELNKVMFSTCPPTNRKWQIEAQQIDIDTDSGRGEAYDATFRLGNVPVLYLPYFNFPVDGRRSTGLLTPSASIDSDSGIKVSIPYYLNLAPNYDATITADVYSNRNPMLTGEVRYLTKDYGSGRLTSSYMANDKQYDDESRSAVFYEHNWTSKNIPRLSADALYSYVSDPYYLNDFDDFGLIENRLNLPRRARVNYYDDNIDAQLKLETFQSLEAVDAEGNVIADKDKPYSRLPQLSIDYRLPTMNNVLDNFLITGVHDSAYFKKSIKDGSDNERSGIRLYNEINASYPLQESWGYVTPKVSVQHLYAAYDEESRIDNNISEDDNDQSVLVPRFSIDSGLNFYQAGSPFGWFDHSLGGYQLLTPRAKYSYSPFEDQSTLPNFDTRIASYDYDQLFADSWFLGYDRIADNNNLAVGLNYRYIDAMGITRFDGSIGDEFFLDKPKVTLNTNDDTFNSDATGVAWQTSLQPYRNLWFDFNGALNSDNDLNYIVSQIRYRPTPSSLINLGVVERKEDTLTNQSKLSALTASAIVPITSQWRFLGQGQFDNSSSKFIDSTLGFDYEDCCYGFSIYGRSYYNDLNLEDKPTRAIMAEFRINGFGDRKSRLSKHLDSKILGFEPVDELWKR